MNTAYLKEAQPAPAPHPATHASTNACNQCMPLGACLVFRGFENTVPFLHGSQGCATYIRRYLISHYREPVDIASSSFSEDSVIFGGWKNLREGLVNVARQYKPEMIAVATTCLAETIGDDARRFIHEIRAERVPELQGIDLMSVPTPSYSGTHTDGFWAAVSATVEHLAVSGSRCPDYFGLCPGMVSPADIRYMNELLHTFRMSCSVVPDYSDTLDGGSWEDYRRIPPGGVPLELVRALGRAEGFIEFASVTPDALLPGAVLEAQHGVSRYRLAAPVGIESTDRLMELLSSLAGRSIPLSIKHRRARLIDSIVDGHKYVASCPVAIFGDEETVYAMTTFACEIGMKPVLCATGGRSPDFKKNLLQQLDELPEDVTILSGVDFAEIESAVKDRGAELLIGNSKGFAMSRRMEIPLLRVGFPIHDRLDGPRMQTFGYSGAQILFDRVCNAIIGHRQCASSVGYTYM
jgi:nitrogenase molybdenum-iron protein NifN